MEHKIKVETFEPNMKVDENPISLSNCDFDSLRIILSRADLEGCDTMVLGFAKKMLELYKQSYENAEPRLRQTAHELADDVLENLNKTSFDALD